MKIGFANIAALACALVLGGLFFLTACQSGINPTALPATPSLELTSHPTPTATSLPPSPTASPTTRLTETITPVQTPIPQSTSIALNAFAVGFSSDGSILAFNSSIPGQVAGGASPQTEAHLYLTESGAIQPVLAGAAGLPISSRASSLSANGRFLLHGARSNAPEPASDHYNFVLLRDIATGQDQRIDFTPLEKEFGASFSIQAVLSPDGSQLALNIASGNWSIHLYDPSTGQHTPVSVLSNGGSENGSSYEPVFSPDGRYLAFVSDSSNLSAGDQPCFERNPACGDVFVYEIATAKLERIPAQIQFTMGNPYPNLTISNNARYLAWTELEDVAVHFRPVIRLYDRQTGERETICAGEEFCSGHAPALSNDGRWLAFASLTGITAQGQWDAALPGQVFLFDRQTGRQTLLSAAPDGTPGDGWSGMIQQTEGFSSDVRISGDGRYVAFASQAANLMPPGVEKRRCLDPYITGEYTCYDLFLYDRQADTLVWVGPPAEKLTLSVMEHPVLPSAVLVFQDASKQLALLDREGRIVLTMDKMGIDPVGFYSDAYQVIGPVSPVDQTVPLALLSFGNFGQIQIWEHQQYTKKIPAPGIISLKSAPGQPLIAYSAFHASTGETARSEVFLLPVDDLPADPSPLIQAELPGSYALFPVAVHARDGTPLGVWLTQQVNGIGGWNFDVNRGLVYVDAASGNPIQALPEDQTLKGLSSDYRYAAYTAEGKVFLCNLFFQEEVSLPTLPESSNGVGYLTFSPDNRLVTWVETTGDGYATPSTLRFWLRVGSTSGEMRFSLESTAFTEAAGFQPEWVQPLGWLDGGTLLIQAREDTSRKSVLLIFDAASGQTALFADGQFAGWVYE